MSAGRHGVTGASFYTATLKMADNNKKKKIMSKGKVKFFNTSRGFGFITPSEGEDLFFHVSELRAETVNEGDQVEYEVGEGRKGPCAVNIREVYNI